MITTIAIRDPHLVRRIAEECERRGQFSPTRTAMDLLIERLSVLDCSPDTVSVIPARPTKVIPATQSA
jgi:hypothetical protein